MTSTLVAEGARRTTSGRSDGRSARGVRTRTAIADATLSLLEAGVLQPTAPQVAERAGVSLRSVFQHFADMEGLYATVAERQIERIMSTVRRVPRDGPVADRVVAFVAERARMHEAVTPVRRAALHVEPLSPEIAKRLQSVRQLGRKEVDRVFAIELSSRTAPQRRELAEALTAAASWSAWETLRAHQGLSVAQARRVMQRTVTALLKMEES
jgi:AcrR family transcriptional regulator